MEKVASYLELSGNREVRLQEACTLQTMGQAKVLRQLLRKKQPPFPETYDRGLTRFRKELQVFNQVFKRVCKPFMINRQAGLKRELPAHSPGRPL